MAETEQWVALGKQIFNDTSLSASGKLSCAGCHDPQHAYAPPNNLAVQLGGKNMDQSGMRAVPSLRYTLRNTPAWHQPFVASMGERIRDGVESPLGGFGWDGRFPSLHQQAAFPLLAANEMANADLESVNARLNAAPYAAELKAKAGSSPTVVDAALYAIEQFELHDASFRPFNSKFDAVLDGKATLTAAEARGFALFNDPTKGNCASCHVASKGQDGSHPLFTNFQYEALGVPRNETLPANHDPHYFDQGVCGPDRRDAQSDARLCGLFKAPSLRNVATRGALFHNGVFHDLKTALHFYVERDSFPERWYPHRGNMVDKFNDLPQAARVNVNTTDLPMTGKIGATPIWNDADIDDVIAFLNTLNDQDLVMH